MAQTLAILRSLHPDWSAADFAAIRRDLKGSLPPFRSDTIGGQVTNTTSGRTANRLDLGGANFVVDAASALSLVALDLGARALCEKRADLALVGGIYIASDVDFSMVFSQLRALSRSGQARPFSARADGTVPGEGVGLVVLKRLADAECDGDRVYAVVKGVGLASDGRGRSVTAPSAKGHVRAIRRAYQIAGIDPQTIGLVEGHGLGLPAADRAELRALRAVFPPSRRRVIGAISSMIGHAMPAAGMAGLIKAALALFHRVLPPTLHADEPHRLLCDADSPFVLNSKTRPWIHPPGDAPRRAAVNAFGFAGINTHAVLEEHAISVNSAQSGCLVNWDSESILLCGASRDDLIDQMRRVTQYAIAHPTISLKDLACTLNQGSQEQKVRLGLVVSSVTDLQERLLATIDRLGDPSCRSIRDARGTYFWDEPLLGRVALVFPGEGSQYPGMLADLCVHFPEVRAVFDTSDRVADVSGSEITPSDMLFGAGGSDCAPLWSIGPAVNVVLSAQWAIYQLLLRLGVKADAVVGHSSGEFLALAAAGVMNVDKTLENRFGELAEMFDRLEACGGVPEARLIAVACDRDRVERCLRNIDNVSVAMDNCPHQVVIAAPIGLEKDVVNALHSEGLIFEVLPFARAYHTPQFEPVVGPMADFLSSFLIQPPVIPVYSCALARRMPNDAIALWAVAQWSRPVRFRETIEAMHADGIRVFIDVGARGNLAGFVEDILRDRPSLAVAASLPRRSGLTQINHLVAALFAQGTPVCSDFLYASAVLVGLILRAARFRR